MKADINQEIDNRRQTAISKILSGNSDDGVRDLMLMIKTMAERDNSNE